MDCTHRHPDRWVPVEVEIGYDGETEIQHQNVGGQSADVDLDIGRFKCSLCGRIGYYTGQWQRFFEEGIPCVGSDNITRPAA